jgi:hypothetical protein
MNVRHFGSILSGLMLLVATSAFGEECPDAKTARNPIIIESQIRDVAPARLDLGDDVAGDAVLIHLIRQPYDILARAGLHVRTADGRRMCARDLQKDDIVRIDGDLDHHTVTALCIMLQRRFEHR